jgi:small redox-active disulfide protein 2
MVEVTRIRVGDDVAGIAGLKEALAEVAEQCGGKPADRAGDALFEILAKRNYIYPGKRDLYRQAFVREYRKFIGEPIDETAGGSLNIKVFGAGCPRCKKLEEDVRTVLAETGVDADVEHVSDLKEIMRTGIMGTPALMIDGKMMVAGSVPPKAKIQEWIERAAGRKASPTA